MRGLTREPEIEIGPQWKICLGTAVLLAGARRDVSSGNFDMHSD